VTDIKKAIYPLLSSIVQLYRPRFLAHLLTICNIAFARAE